MITATPIRQVTAALAAYQAGQGSEQAALTALAGARLLVPVVAVLADGPAAAGEKTAGERQRATRTARWCCPR